MTERFVAIFRTFPHQLTSFRFEIHEMKFSTSTVISVVSAYLLAPNQVALAVESFICDEGQGKTDGSNTCFMCPIGEFGIGQDECNPCGPGLFTSTVGQSVCTPCEAGTFKAGDVAELCKPCEDNMFAAITGASNCAQCVNGIVTPTSCVCRAGDVVAPLLDMDATSSPTVSPPEVRNQNPVECVPCPDGFFEEDGVCVQCPVNTFKSGDSITCKPCPTGEYQPAKGQDGCVECDGGIIGNGDCLCPANTELILDCKGGEAGLTKGGEAVIVLMQQSRNGGECGDAATPIVTAKCEDCVDSEKILGTAVFLESVGYDNGKCTACAIGEEFDGSSCTPCEPGEYYDTADKTCKTCSSNEFSSTFGATECTSCAGTPVKITGDSVSTAGPALKDACSCGEGLYPVEGNDGSITCEQCAPGTFFSGGFNVGVCEPCGQGTIATGFGNVNCAPCDTEEYQDQPGQTTCIACNDSAPSGYCSDCTEGDNTTGECMCLGGRGFIGNDCAECAAGFEVPAGSNVCEVCPDGTYSPVAGGECMDCGEGVVTDGTSCACNEGAVLEGDTCELCNNGEFSSEGECLKCEGETASLKGASECFLCLNNDGYNGKCNCNRKTVKTVIAGGFECRLCNPNEIFVKGICSACSDNSIPSLTDSHCLPCADGLIKSDDGSECVVPLTSEPTDEPTDAPTDAPVEPTDTPTDAPVEPTDAPTEAADAPVMVTAATDSPSEEVTSDDVGSCSVVFILPGTTMILSIFALCFEICVADFFVGIASAFGYEAGVCP